MTELKRDVQDDRGVKKRVTEDTQPPRVSRERTAGEDRDYDETQVSENQGHGHPRERQRPQLDRRARDD